MSYQATRWACGQRAGSAPAKAVLMVLAEHADKNGLSWPSTRTIAEEAECDQRSVRRHLDALKDRELVSWTPGAGRGSNRYQLAVVRHSDASQDGASEARSASLQDEVDGRSEASRDRSEALDHRSETTRASDQQRSEQNHYVEPEQIEPTAAPQQPRGRGGARPREAVPLAELARTAGRADATLIVREWLERNPGITAPRQRDLRKAVSVELDRGADPALMGAALDEAHGNPRWHHPVKALPMAYEQVRRRAQQAARPVAAAEPENRTDANIRALLGGSIHPAQSAIGGTW